MTRLSIRYLLVGLIALVPCAAHGAESLKLRPAGILTGDNNQMQVLLKDPAGVACDDKGNVVVADSLNARLVLYQVQADGIKGGTPTTAKELAYPLQVQFDSKGNIYTLDGKLRRILEFKPDGSFVGFIDAQGVPAPATVVPASFAIDVQDSFYIMDIFGERVLETDATGKFKAQFAFPKPYGFFTDVTVSPTGDLLLLDSLKGVIYHAKKGTQDFVPLVSNLGEYLTLATNITTDYRGTIYLTDHDGAAIVVVGPDGTMLGRQLSLGWKNGQLYYPTQMCVNKSGDLFIADKGNSRVQYFKIIK